jgi:hypothetical protein
LGLVQRQILGYPAPMRMHGLAEGEVRSLLAAGSVDVDPVDYQPDWRELRYFCVRRPE